MSTRKILMSGILLLLVCPVFVLEGMIPINGQDPLTWGPNVISEMKKIKKLIDNIGSLNSIEYNFLDDMISEFEKGNYSSKKEIEQKTAGIMGTSLVNGFLSTPFKREVLEKFKAVLDAALTQEFMSSEDLNILKEVMLKTYSTKFVKTFEGLLPEETLKPIYKPVPEPYIGPVPAPPRLISISEEQKRQKKKFFMKRREDVKKQNIANSDYGNMVWDLKYYLSFYVDINDISSAKKLVEEGIKHFRRLIKKRNSSKKMLNKLKKYRKLLKIGKIKRLKKILQKEEAF